MRNSSNQYLLLFLQLVHHGYVDTKRGSDDVGRGESQPLRQADVGNAVALIEFDPD